MTFYHCPHCGKKGVTLRPRANGKDHYACRYCDWFVFTRGNQQGDFRERAAFVEANPGVEWLVV
jgi:DNA-directed RNA polymerase subunit RPC12/RpoP